MFEISLHFVVYYYEYHIFTNIFFNHLLAIKNVVFKNNFIPWVLEIGGPNPPNMSFFANHVFVNILWLFTQPYLPNCLHHKLAIPKFCNGNHVEVILSRVCNFCTHISCDKNMYDACISRMNVWTYLYVHPTFCHGHKNNQDNKISQGHEQK
jgi:hypothetical protein